MKIKVTDYITEFLVNSGIKLVFGMSGGAAVHMYDSINKNNKIKIISMTHEQCAAIAADGYARTTNNLGVAISTSGPGATNLLTGVCCSFYDSIPMLIITGQVSTNRLKYSKNLRQYGFQETDTKSIFKSVTKYSTQLKKPSDIRYKLEKAFYFALKDRRGPVHIDIPDDLQRSEVNIEDLYPFIINNKKNFIKTFDNDLIKLIEIINSSLKATLILGGGLKTPPVGNIINKVITKLDIPVLTTWAALDLLKGNDKNNFGTFGVYGNRLGNKIIQNSDLIIILGSRLSQNLTGGLVKSFAPKAKIVLVDIDKFELLKFKKIGINIHTKIHSPLDKFLYEFYKRIKDIKIRNYINWKKNIINWQKEISLISKEKKKYSKKFVDPKEFTKILSHYIPSKSNIFIDTGGNLTWTCNNIKTKENHRIFSSWNFTPMGYSLPACIGSCLSNNNARHICIIGDGGLMLCLSELITVIKHNLNMKIFLYNNHGHGIQKQTLRTWLNGNFVGVDEKSGLSFPKNWDNLVKSLGMKNYTITKKVNIDSILKKIMRFSGPVFTNVEIDPNEPLHPFLKYGQKLDNQYPTLNNELISNDHPIKNKVLKKIYK